jgi:hypothetical protein
MDGHIDGVWTGPDESDPGCDARLQEMLDEKKRDLQRMLDEKKQKERKMSLKRRAEKLFGPII